jgi:hypothetical protein
VLVAAVTVPTAPRLKATLLADGVVALNPLPAIVRVVVEIGMDREGFAVTVGAATMVATCVAAPLVAPSVVTTAVSVPSDVGAVEKVTVSDVLVAAVTVPAAPLLNATVLAPGVVLNPLPVMTSVGALIARYAELVVTVGDCVTVATCTAAPLEPPNAVTEALSLPAVGGVVSWTTSNCRVADVT